MVRKMNGVMRSGVEEQGRQREEECREKVKERERGYEMQNRIREECVRVEREKE